MQCNKTHGDKCMFYIYEHNNNNNEADVCMSIGLSDLDHTIQELKVKISLDPDPFLFEVLNRLLVIRKNQQPLLVDRAYRNEKTNPKGGYRGFGVS